MLQNRKGQEPLTIVMIVGIMVVIISAVYFWGAPLIEKNKNFAEVKSAENFMTYLNDKIKSIANNGGREQIQIESGTVRFDPGIIRLAMETGDAYYTKDVWIPLTEGNCTIDGVWGEDPPESLCVKSESAGSSYRTTYELRYRRLDAGLRTYQISLDGTTASGSEGNIIVIENAGSSIEGNLIRTHISIRII